MAATSLLSGKFSRAQLGAIVVVLTLFATGLAEFQLKQENSKKVRLLLWRMSDLMEMHQDKRAIALGKEAILIDPRDPFPNLHLSWAYNDLQEFEDALFYANRAVLLRPDDPDLLTRRSKAYTALGRYDEASKDRLQIIAMGVPDAYAGLAEIKIKEKKFDEALQILNDGFKTNQEDHPDLRAKIYEELGRHDKAIEQYRNIVKLCGITIKFGQRNASYEKLPYLSVTGEYLCQEYGRRSEAAFAAGDVELAAADQAKIRWIKAHTRPRQFSVVTAQ
jgi:tetratricopeptide (TPR) repeat protein